MFLIRSNMFVRRNNPSWFGSFVRCQATNLQFFSACLQFSFSQTFSLPSSLYLSRGVLTLYHSPSCAHFISLSPFFYYSLTALLSLSLTHTHVHPGSDPSFDPISRYAHSRPLSKKYVRLKPKYQKLGSEVRSQLRSASRVIFFSSDGCVD